ncbi:MAG: aldo/keto reductase [Oscillospiraceae bacterium]|nr:aldo/keto reductase [Oscillospiraceae bacterium]
MDYLADDNRYSLMSYARCGKSGLKLPRLSLGLWHNFGADCDYDNMKRLCFTAFDLGITHFDLADNYGPGPGAAELNFGSIVREELAQYRDELIISTKAGYHMWEGPYGDWGSRKHLISGLDSSLLRLGLDYVDIFYHHRMDPETPLEETMGALDSIVRSGKALYIGLSNYDGETMLRAAEILKRQGTPYVINQNRYSIFDRKIEKNGLLAANKNEDKGLIVFSPLAQGLLSERYLYGIPADSRAARDGRFLKRESINGERLEQIEALNKIARSRGQTLAQMALAWVLREGVTSALIGASKPSQIEENVKALESLSFWDDELAAIDKIAPA